jgi:dienelactone hydrolase
VGVPAASALLAACGGGDGDGGPASSTTGAAATPPRPAVATRAITFPGPQRRTLQGAWAAAALERAGLTHEIVTYPGANHAFFNDTGPRYHPDAAAQAYAKVLDWFGRHLG